jgi:ABC-2 type transport system permease protein
MPVFSTYFKILKDKRRTIIIYALICIGLTYALTMNTDAGNDQFETSKVKTMIINEDGQSALVDGFLDYLDEYATIVSPGKNEEAIKDALFFGEADYVLTIPKGFSESFLKNGTIKLEKEAVPDSIAAMSLDNVIDNYFNMAKTYIKYVPQLDAQKLNSYINKSLKVSTATSFDTKTTDKVVYSNEFNGFFFNFLGYAIIGTFISVISLIMLSFNQSDIQRRHNASPFGYKRMNLQLILANLIFVIGFFLVAVIIGLQMNKCSVININMILIWLNALVFCVTVLCASYMIGIMVRSRKAVGAISTVLSLGLSFISGIFVTQSYLGGAVRKVASISPVYWYVKANDSLSAITACEWKQVSGPFGDMAIEVGFTIAFISIALVISKRNRQQSF